MLPSLLSFSAKLWSTAYMLPLLPHLSLTQHPRQYHFWPQFHPYFPKQHWHRSPKTSNLSEPMDMSQSSFRTSLLHMTLLAINSLLLWAFPSCSVSECFLPHLGGLLSACPSAHSFQPFQATLCSLINSIVLIPHVHRPPINLLVSL